MDDKQPADKAEKESVVFQRFEEFLEIIPKEAFLEEIVEDNFVEWLETHVEDQGLINDIKDILEFNEINKVILIELIQEHVRRFKDASIEE